MIKLVNTDASEELPIALEMTSLEHLPMIIKIVSKLLIQLKPLIANQELIPFYCICTNAEYMHFVRQLLMYEERKLPTGCEFYQCDGNKVFEIRGPSGGITTAVCFYLLAR